MTGVALLRSEWTKFRTVSGWVVGMVVAALLIVLIAVVTGASAVSRHGGGPVSAVPLGPGGEAVTDSFYFVHQPITGHGVLTASVTSLRATISGVRDPGPA